MTGVTIEGPVLAAVTRTLGLAECHALLRERGWAILSTVEMSTARP